MSWLLAFAGFAALIILHEFGHFIVAKATGMRVERFYLFFPPAIAKTKRGETEYGIGAIPLGGFVKITGMNPDEELPPDVAPRAYYHQPVWKRIVVISAGPAMNLLIAFVILFGLGFGLQKATDRVGAIESGSPAAQKLQPGDKIVSVDGKTGAEARARALDAHGCSGEPEDGCRAATPADVVVIRDGERKKLEIRPEFDSAAPAIDGEGTGRMRLGFEYASRPVDSTTGEAASFALDRMWFVASQTVEVIVRIFDPEQREQISGVVGSYEVTRQSIEFDTRQALGIVALISLSLAVINLFPFLPLDGGHIFWSLVEKVRGKPVPFSVMERAGVIGFALVLVLFVVGLSNDIGRLTGEGFQVR